MWRLMGAISIVSIGEGMPKIFQPVISHDDGGHHQTCTLVEINGLLDSIPLDACTN